MSFLFLGTGASLGVPLIGCSCDVCTSSSLHNKRLRCCGLVKIGDKRFLIDAGPDVRFQALKFGIDHLDGVLLTHTHYDHIGGLDDLRPFYFKNRPLPCLLSKESLEDLKVRYHYLIPEDSSICSRLEFHLLPDRFGSVWFCGGEWKYVSFSQAGMQVTGYRLGGFAYISDIREYSEEVVSSLKGVEILVVSALRHAASKLHFGLDEAISFSRSVGAKRTFFTHIAHDLDHDVVNKMLPQDIRLAYDGLEIQMDFAREH